MRLTFLSPILRQRWRRFSPATGRGRRVAAAVVLLLLLSGIGAGLMNWRGWRKENLLLTSPVLAVEELRPSSLYYNGLAWPWLHRLRPDLLSEAEERGDAERVRSFTQAVQSPKLFRQLDRQFRFETLLLVGDPSQFRPLLDHLLETRDWTLTYVDPTSLIWKRGAVAPWDLHRLDAVRARFATASARDRGTFLALCAGKLLAVREPAAARALLEEAQTLGANSAEVESVWAQYHLARGEWHDAEAAADRALKLDGTSLAALGCKAQALYATKRFGEAYALSKRLMERRPDDPNLLFYHAKIAHEARAFEQEADALRRLILLAEANDRPTATYRVYLGQALASSGEAQPALSEFQRAIADPECPPEQRQFARDCVQHVRSQMPAQP